jgi:hypothetical protein
MDNISGIANWFLQDKEKLEEVIVEEVTQFVAQLNTKLISTALEQARHDYKATNKKQLGDAIVHLEVSLKLLNK